METYNVQKWRLLERLAAQLQSDEATPELTIFPNTSIRGNISGTRRQVDVLVDARWDDGRERRVVVDAKHRKRKVDIKLVEEFEGMMRDCQARHGVIVCTGGYTAAALRRAQDAITIRLVGLDELERFSLASWDECQGRCSLRKSRWSSRGLVLWENPHGLTVNDSPLSIAAVGKCDICGDFNIWCWDCGRKFALSSDDTFKCDCEWFWLTATEEEIEEAGGSSYAIHLYMILLQSDYRIGAGAVIPVDRHRLS